MTHAGPAAVRLGRHLRSIGYDERHLRARLGRIPERLTASLVAAAERRAGNDPLGAGIRFWRLGLPASAADLEASTAGVSAAELEADGLLEQADDGVRATVSITPALGRLQVHDFDRGQRMSRDHVLGVSPSTRTLAGLTPRAPVQRALDIGSGCGAQAFGLAEHAEEVIATDISERAAWASRVGAELNDIESIEVRLGDGLVPVGDETFDLIVSNPSFVIGPMSEITFRDAETRGDEMSRSLVRGVAPHLRPRGVACVLVNWIVRRGESLSAAAEGWLQGLPTKTVLLQHEALDPASYARRWAILSGDASIEEHRASFDRWMAELRRLEARFVVSGAVLMQRTDGPGTVRVVKMPRRPFEGGAHVRRMLDAIGRFEGADDERLGGTVFRLIDGHSVEQRLHFAHGEYSAGPATMRLDRSAGVVGRVPADVLEAVFSIDGEATLNEIAADVAAARGVDAHEFESTLRPIVADLYETGLLDVVEPD